MNPGITANPARVARRVLILAACLALSACAKKVTQVDPGYTTPEGVPSADSRLVMWFAGTTSMEVRLDKAPLGVSDTDSIIGSLTITEDPLGTIHGMLFDRTPAESYQILRRESGGGLRAYEDFPRPPTRKWLASEWETYRFDDFSPSSFEPPSYIGRGLIEGDVTQRSPLSNEGVLSPAPLTNLNIQVVEDPSDSVSIIRWDTVPGALNYLLHIYEFRNASVSQQQVSGIPAPIFDGQSRDHFVLWFRWGAGSVAEYKLGDTTRTDLDILYERRLLPQPLPAVGSAIVRVSAFDAAGRMIAMSLQPAGNPPGSFDLFPRNYGVAPVSDNSYGVFPLGGLQVERIRFPRYP